MRPAYDQFLSLRSPDETWRLGTRMAGRLCPGDCILLDGPIGAGKSHFARAVIHELLAREGRLEDIPSPTYTLVQTYESERADIWHADLYRVSSAAELEEIGLSSVLEDSICLIEWPDRFGSDAPPGALMLRLSYGDAENERRLHLIYDDPKWTQRIAGAIPPGDAVG